MGVSGFILWSYGRQRSPLEAETFGFLTSSGQADHLFGEPGNVRDFTKRHEKNLRKSGQKLLIAQYLC